jgi:hypothetical protein
MQFVQFLYMISKMESDVQRVGQNFRCHIWRRLRSRLLGLIDFYTVLHGINRTVNVAKSIFLAEVKELFLIYCRYLKTEAFLCVWKARGQLRSWTSALGDYLWSQVRWTTVQERTVAGFVCVTAVMLRDMIRDTPCINIQSGFSRAEIRVKYYKYVLLVQVLLPAEEKNFPSPKVIDRQWGPSSLLFNDAVGSFAGWRDQGVKVTIQVHVEPRLRLHGAMSALSCIRSWRSRGQLCLYSSKG